MSFRQKLIDEFRNAFAVGGTESPLTVRQDQLVDIVCKDIVRRRLTTPALAMLEMSRPLNYLGAQALHFFQPMISALTDADGPREFALFLERRDSVDILAARIETLERAASQ